MNPPGTAVSKVQPPRGSRKIGIELHINPPSNR